MTLAVIVPTITGREEWLERCLESYERTSPAGTKYLIYRDHETCGEAWDRGARDTDADYLHFTADDIEAHDGWWQPALDACDRGCLPAPRVLNTDGTLQSCGDVRGSPTEQEDWSPAAWTVVPTLSRRQWELIGLVPPIHYSSDVWITERGRQRGIETVVRRDYLLTHHFAPQGRYGQGRMVRDAAALEGHLRDER